MNEDALPIENEAFYIAMLVYLREKRHIFGQQPTTLIKSKSQAARKWNQHVPRERGERRETFSWECKGTPPPMPPPPGNKALRGY